jgi:serine/threonine protein kinase/WD40 repeat protein
MALATGTRLGPYEILDLVGAGGMGEVYRAFDPRLGREVAIKVLPEEVGSDPERLARFEREARAVAALNHPNILTVFDVGLPRPDDTSSPSTAPYVVTELLEGETLRELVSRRTPTQRQVLSFTVQVAHGLDAAHTRGIVHRDLKPENVFVTTDGRVKLLDFGLAKVIDRQAADSLEPTAASPTEAGQMVGTVGYMSPEQVRGLAVDARTDVFSLGVVLYELLGGKHPFRRETAVATLTAILEATPVDLVSLGRGVPPAVSGIVRRCLEKGREERYPSAHDVGVALEAVLQAPAGAALLQKVEERSPYPGLMSFTEKDADHFFGREAEVAALWERLRSRHLSGVIGPSGAGKTSFVRAGVVPSPPPEWVTLVCTPGAAPFRGLAHALASELAGDAETVRELLRFDEPAVAFDVVSRWRKGHGEALLVVDQFEELFTLSPDEVQERFAGLLGRLAREADVHVLLSLRDDFLMKCADHAGIAKVFESLAPLPALSREGLRRAIEEPGKKLGYRFEDETLVAEMIESVEGARGALPLLAFAVARLWEKRDRERKLLTREAYEEIGGVAGALAQHAEATMDTIGPGRQGIVREIFRNLVTSQGTRAAAEREELLSAFPQRQDADEVLRELIDARLVTSYEVEGKEGEPSRHRVEVVHESLLKAWPRLVRWQAQDEEGAVLRDQLKQAAHLWAEKGRTSDLLWTGTAFREYELWRDRYAGALTAIEEDFAKAMAEKARRRKRLLTAAVATVIVTLAGIAIAIGISRHQTAAARDAARVEALRAEAGKLLALGRSEIDRYPTAALAYVRKSLELADTPEARRLAVEVLWRGPVARILSPDRIVGGPDAAANPGWDRPVFSPDGRWLALENRTLQRVLLFSQDGGAPVSIPRPPDAKAAARGFGPQSDLFVSAGPGTSLRFLSVPGLQEIRRIELGGVGSGSLFGGGKLFTNTWMAEGDRHTLFRSWSLPEGEPTTLGTIDWQGVSSASLDPTGHALAYASGRSIYLRPLDEARLAAPRLLGSHPDPVSLVAFFPAGDRVASLDKAGEIRIWSAATGAPSPLRAVRGLALGGAEYLLAVDREGMRVAWPELASSAYLWDLRDPPDALPLVLRSPDPAWATSGTFDPSGRWLASADAISVAFWPLTGPWKRTLPGALPSTYQLGFTPEGRWLASCVISHAVRLWPLSPADGAVRALAPSEPCWGLADPPTKTHVLLGTWPDGRVLLAPISGGPPRPLRTGWEGMTVGMAFDSGGRRAAACPMGGRLRVLRVWDLESGHSHDHSLANLAESPWRCEELAFAPDGAVFAALRGGVFRVVSPEEPGGTVSAECVHAAGRARFALSSDGRKLLVSAGRSADATVFEELLVFDLATRTSRPITTHGRRLWDAAFDPSGRIVVTGDIDGVVRVGPATGEEPHLLFGHAAHITRVAVSPDGRWIVSASDDAYNLWPMPDVTKPPLHTLPYPELMAKLDALTNLRVVREASAATGWKLDVGPFPGWKDVPTW